VAAFKATLEELAEADVLLHVVDASHPGLDDQVTAVEQVLQELELVDRPTIVVLNKVDRLDGSASLAALVDRFHGVPVSALTGDGIEALLDRIDRALRPGVERAEIVIPYSDGPTLAMCYERGRVLARSDEPDGIHLEVELPRRLVSGLAPYRATA
jgi:GTP-binding protein HflX